MNVGTSLDSRSSILKLLTLNSKGSTACFLLSTVLTEGWATSQVDYTNALDQADLMTAFILNTPTYLNPSPWSVIW